MASPLKITLYGTCSFPFFYREVIRRAQELKLPIEWKVILLTWRHESLFDGILPKKDLFYVQPEVNRWMKEGTGDLSEFASYPDSLARDIAADKDVPGQLKRRSKDYQIRNSAAYYRAYKAFLTANRPDYVILPTVETHEGMILFELCRELGIHSIFRTVSRSFHSSIFSQTPLEDLPVYAARDKNRPEIQKQARLLADQFRAQLPKAWAYPYEPKPEELIPFAALQPPWKKLHKLPGALLNHLRDAVKEPHNPRPNPLWYQPLLQFYGFSLFINRIKAVWRRHYFDLQPGKYRLPEKFFFMPLHVYPELSVTSVAPYFEDPLRAIDLFLFNMPADHYLVVKEHPMMRGRRPGSLYRDLKKKAGVLFADPDIPSSELIRKAALTVGIAGTGGLEALFMGRPSISLGQAFFTPWVPKLDTFDKCAPAIRAAMAQTPEDLHAKSVDLIASVLASSYPFLLFDPHDPSLDPKYLINRHNIDAFLQGLQDHIRKSEEMKNNP